MGRQVAVLYLEFEQINRGELGEEGEVWCRLEEVEASYIGCAQGHVGVKSVGRGDVEGGRGAKCSSVASRYLRWLVRVIWRTFGPICAGGSNVRWQGRGRSRPSRVTGQIQKERVA